MYAPAGERRAHADDLKGFRRTACKIKFSDMRGEFGFSEVMQCVGKTIPLVRIPPGKPAGFQESAVLFLLDKIVRF